MKIHGPVYRDELASSFSISWSRAPYIEGGWQKIPGGPEAPVYAPLNAPAGRVHFAGDWLSHLVSWQHEAFRSARKAVTALHTRSLPVQLGSRLDRTRGRLPRCGPPRRPNRIWPAGWAWR